MKKPVFLAAVLLFLMALAIDVAMIFSGLTMLGVFSLLGTILVFSAGIVWFIHLDDEVFHIKNLYLALPLGVFGFAILKVIRTGNLGFKAASEDLSSVGNLMMSRYQVGIWLVSAAILLIFVLAGSVMVRRKA